MKPKDLGNDLPSKFNKTGLQLKDLEQEDEEGHVHFDQEQVDFKFLQNFINCYKDKMMLNLKDDEEGELLEMLSSNKNQEVDISIDF